MQLTAIITLLSATLAGVASAGSIQVNYYTDGGCTAYASTPPNTPTNGGCYNWQWTGSNSANIANCNGFRQCTCLFYTQPNCAGGLQSAQYGGNNCASNWGQGWVSFRCQGVN